MSWRAGAPAESQNEQNWHQNADTISLKNLTEVSLFPLVTVLWELYRFALSPWTQFRCIKIVGDTSGWSDAFQSTRMLIRTQQFQKVLMLNNKDKIELLTAL